MSKKSIVFGLSVLLAVVGLALWIWNGKDSAPSVSDTGQSEQANTKVDVVASFYPLAFLAREIGGDRVVVKDIAGSHEVHEYSPTPQDVISMHNATIVLYLGLGIEPWVPDMQETLRAKGVGAVAVASFVLSEEEVQEAEERAHEEGNKGGEDAHEEHEHGDVNPHIWLDPVLMEKMADGISAKLAEIDPDGAQYYADNATALKEKLADLDAAYRSGLAQCSYKEVIVSHDAFERLADRYGFTTHAIAGISTEDEPSAATLAKLKAEAEEGSAAYILTEEAASARFAEALSRETGLEMLTVHTLEFDPSDGEDYIDVMRHNLGVFSKALECE